jgi:hypothetical protein
MAIVITEKDREKAFALFDQGESPNRVATLLFSAHWYKAKKLHDEYLKLNPPAPQAQAVDVDDEHLKAQTVELERDEICDAIGEINIESTEIVLADRAELSAEIEPEVPEVETDPETWDITVRVSAARMDQIVAGFSSQEKADAIAAVLTGRLSAEA